MSEEPEFDFSNIDDVIHSERVRMLMSVLLVQTEVDELVEVLTMHVWVLAYRLKITPTEVLDKMQETIDTESDWEDILQEIHVLMTEIHAPGNGT
jgi:hypothetical protein